MVVRQEKVKYKIPISDWRAKVKEIEKNQSKITKEERDRLLSALNLEQINLK